MINCFIANLWKVIDFRGRSSRREYCSFLLASIFLVILSEALSVARELIPILKFGPVAVLSLIALMWPSITIRRMHDIGFSGWFAIGFLIPWVGLAVQLGLVLLKGSAGPNKYGADPMVLARYGASVSSWSPNAVANDGYASSDRATGLHICFDGFDASDSSDCEVESSCDDSSDSGCSD